MPPIALNSAVLDFIIKQATRRWEDGYSPDNRSSRASVAVFDELDSLPLEELIPICALFQLGAGHAESTQEAMSQAEVIGLSAVEVLWREPQLHRLLNDPEFIS